MLKKIDFYLAKRKSNFPQGKFASNYIFKKIIFPFWFGDEGGLIKSVSF